MSLHANITCFCTNISLVTHFYCCDQLGPEPKPVLPGDTRTYRIWLDPNQYQQDMEKTAKGEAEDVYESLNVIMRRKPKENNFKVSLSHYMRPEPNFRKVKIILSQGNLRKIVHLKSVWIPLFWVNRNFDITIFFCFRKKKKDLVNLKFKS